jgi:hypothetical protein
LASSSGLKCTSIAAAPSLIVSQKAARECTSRPGVYPLMLHKAEPYATNSFAPPSGDSARARAAGARRSSRTARR